MTIKKRLGDALRHSPLSPLMDLRLRWMAIGAWTRAGRPAPPPAVIKYDNLRRVARAYGLRTLVETGTLNGDTIHALRSVFDTIYSVELGEELYRRAVARFEGDAHIRLSQGDSGVVLGEIVPGLAGPALFWLDGHYSGGDTARGDKNCPIYEELAHIFRSSETGHVLMIDDARMFVGADDYPTLTDLSDFVRSHRPDVRIDVVEDCIRVLPPDPARGV